MSALRGKVTLIDFWTYSCVNCLRTLPHLKEWHKRYAAQGLVVIGVHTPEFAFEKDAANVKAAIKEHKLMYPVVLDSSYAIWNLYANHWWPRKILIDHKGMIVYDHVGEGEYAQTERAIQAALRRIGAKRLPKIERDDHVGGGVCHPTTPEAYLGALRGRFANAMIERGHIVNYRRPTMAGDRPALQGAWKVEGEYAQSHGGKLLMPYMAGEVNLVMALSPDARVKKTVEVRRDGKAMVRAEAGDDISFAKKASVVTVDHPRMYRLVFSKQHHGGLLELEVPSGVRVFAFTFGGACA